MLFHKELFPQGFSRIVKTSVHNTKCDVFDTDSTDAFCLTLYYQMRDSDFMQCCRQYSFFLFYEVKPCKNRSFAGEGIQLRSVLASIDK